MSWIPHHQEYIETTKAHGLETETDPTKMVPHVDWDLPWNARMFSSLQPPIHQPSFLPFQLEKQEIGLPSIALGKLPEVVQVWLMSRACSSHAQGRPPGDSHDAAQQRPPPHSSQGQIQGGRLFWISENPQVPKAAKDRCLYHFQRLSTPSKTAWPRRDSVRSDKNSP